MIRVFDLFCAVLIGLAISLLLPKMLPKPQKNGKHFERRNQEVNTFLESNNVTNVNDKDIRRVKAEKSSGDAPPKAIATLTRQKRNLTIIFVNVGGMK